MNIVHLSGNFTKKPESRDVNIGGRETKVANFTIASSRKFKKKDGTYDEETQWHQVVVWDSALVKTFKGKALKGAEVYLKGELIHRTYGEKDNLKYITEVVVPQFRGKLIIIAKSNGDSGVAAQPIPQVANEVADEIPI